MICKDIVEHMIQYLPRESSLFSEYFNPETVSVVGETVSVMKTSHGLKDGQPIAVTGAERKTLVSAFTVVSDGIQVTTATSHDMSDGWLDNQTIKMVSATDPSIDDTYYVTSIIDGKNFIIPSFPDTVLTDVYILENIDYGINGMFLVSVSDADNFTYTLDFGEDIPITFTPVFYPSSVKVHNALRISGSDSIERFLKSYEKKNADKLWMCIVVDDASFNKANTTQTDATNEQGGGGSSFWNVKMMSPFSVYVVVPCNEINGRRARDLALAFRPSLYKAIIGASFSDGFTGQTISGVTPEDDGAPIYNTAYYVHHFQFSQMTQISNDDTLFSQRTTPLRSISIDFQRPVSDNDSVIMELSATLDE